MRKCFFCLYLCLMAVGVCKAQPQITEPTQVFLMHSSGNHLKKGNDNGGYLESATAANPQKMTLTPDGEGYYTIQTSSGNQYLSKLNAWNTTFVSEATSDDTKFSLEPALGSYLLLRCKGNGLCLGTDSNDPELPGWTSDPSTFPDWSVRRGM